MKKEKSKTNSKPTACNATKSRVGETLPASTPNASKNAIPVVAKEGQDPAVVIAKAKISPHISNPQAIIIFGRGTLGTDTETASFVTALIDVSREVHGNDLKDVEAMLMSQATVLNVMFGELTSRSAINLNGSGEYMPAMETYFRMALKAQNQCRMTLETLSNIKNPPVVYAKQANIANGPQQVNNGTQPRAHAEENQTQPNKLLEKSNEQRMDSGTQGTTGSGNPPMEAVAALNGT